MSMTANVEMAAASPGGLVTASELAKVFDVDPRTLRNWVALGQIPAPIRVSGRIYWRRADIARFLGEKSVEAQKKGAAPVTSEPAPV